MISTNSRMPRYKQLSQILTTQIGKGIFKSNERLPSELELSKKYKLNRHTVRQAIATLEREGLVYKIRGKGTFVATSKIPYKVSKKTRFTASILEIGLNPNAKLISSYEIRAGGELSEKLGLTPSDKVIVLEILRFINGVSFCHTTSFLSQQRFPKIQDYLKENFSLYELLHEYYSVEVTRAFSTFEVSLPEDSDVQLLNITPTIPILIVKSTAKDQNGQVVEYCITKFRGDMCSILVNFNDERR